MDTMGNEVTLKEYFDSQIKNIEKSIETAYRSMEKRLDGMNEFREALKDQSRQFVSRQEFETLQKLVWVGVGIVLAVEFLLRFFVK
jgi:hypothetical protein